MRRCGWARCRRSSTLLQIGARRGQPAREHAPPAFDLLVQALPPLVEQPARIAEPRLRALQLVAGAPQRPGQRAAAAAPQRAELLRQIVAHRDRALGGGRRRRRAQVGDEVGDGEVGLVADRGDHGDAAGEDRARHRLLVERPQVLERAAAARDDDDVDVGDRFQPADRRRDAQRGAVALHRRGRQQDRDREAAVRDVDDVADDGARGDVTTPIRRGRNGSGRLRASSNSPSAPSRCLSCSNASASAPAPVGSIATTDI